MYKYESSPLPGEYIRTQSNTLVNMRHVVEMSVQPELPRRPGAKYRVVAHMNISKGVEMPPTITVWRGTAEECNQVLDLIIHSVPTILIECVSKESPDAK